MTKRQLVVLQCSILALIVAILFPPYGYSRWVETRFPNSETGQTSVEVKTHNDSWQQVGYSFILSAPPAPSFTGWHEHTYSEAEVKIAGHVLAAEIAIIVLLTTGAFITLGYKRKLPDAR
jgi:hypothetical protein